jgi:protein-S-isoprenylcysteine O-methyltransferase Ste14
MHATRFEFRYRSAIMIVLYVIGFVAPWHWLGHWLVAEPLRGETWGVLIAQISRTRLLDFNSSFVLVNAGVLACAWTGSLLRWWATASIGLRTMGSDALVAEEIVVTGPYRYLRYPLYLGAWLLAFPVAIIMEPTGALFLIVTLMIFLLRLAAAEQLFLDKRTGEISRGENVPVRARTDWLRAGIVECYGLILAITFSIFCWSFNAQLLLRCAMISLGASLVLNAVVVPHYKPAAQ